MELSSKYIKNEIEGRQATGMARSITKRVTLNLIIGVVLTVLTVSGGVLWMAAAQNQQAREATVTMIEGGVSATEESVVALVNDYGWWQDAFDAYEVGDSEFIEENIGASVYDTMIADTAAIISTEKEVRYGWIIEDYGLVVDDVFSTETVNGIFRLAQGMPIQSLSGRSGYIVIDGQVLLLGVSQIAPINRLETIKPGDLPFIVFGFVLTDELLHNLGESFLIDDLRLLLGDEAKEEQYVNFPAIVDIDGVMVGRFVWTPPVPGYTVLQSVSLPIFLALLVFFIIVVSTASRTRKIAVALSNASQDLQASEQELAKQLMVVASEKERIEAIVSSVGEGLLVVGPEGRVFMSNKTASFILGKSEESMLGTELKAIFGVKGVKKLSPFAPVLDVLMKKQTVRVQEASFARDDGEMVILALTATPVDLEGSLIGGVIVFHDVTEQNLIAAAKDQFITTAAHQLRTPLSGIRWAMSLILDGSVGEVKEEQRELIKKSYDSVNRLNLLINDLLDIDKLETEKKTLNFVPVDIALLLKDILNELDGQISQKKIKVSFDPKVEGIEPELDKGSVQVVFQNLVENAVRYTKEGGEVRIEVEKEPKAVHVSVEDNGIGIPRNQQKSIFTRFFRAGNAQLMEPDGSGLGLYITKQIVDRHKGKMWFESEEGKGTVFHVTLPLLSKSKKNQKKAKKG